MKVKIADIKGSALDCSTAKAGDTVLCVRGGGTGFLRRGRQYIIEHVAPSGYVRVEGSADYYSASARFCTLKKG
jgi:hypothetical protein